MDFSLKIKNYTENSFTSIWNKVNSEEKDDLNDYKPTFYLSHPFLQSIYNAFEKRFHFSYERQELFFEDGGHIALDWTKKMDSELAPPVLLIVHGLTGGSECNYIKEIIIKGQQ